MDVYADLLFLINFFMDLACLEITSKACGCTAGKMRKLLAAVLGAVYSVIALFIENGAVYYITAAAAGVTLILTAFARRQDRALRVIKISLVYFFVNMLVGGSVSAAFYLLERFSYGAPLSPEPQERLLSPSVCLALSTGCFVSYLALKYIRRVKVVEAGTHKTVYVCSRCLRSGKVERA